MKLENLVKQYGKYTVKEGFLKYLEEPEPETVWDLKDGDEYWRMQPNRPKREFWKDSVWHRFNRSTGNCFLTSEEAEKELKKREIETELRRMAEGYKFTAGLDNWMLYFDSRNYFIDFKATDFEWFANTVWFPTKELAEKAVEKIGEDRLIQNYFWVA